MIIFISYSGMPRFKNLILYNVVILCGVCMLYTHIIRSRSHYRHAIINSISTLFSLLYCAFRYYVIMNIITTHKKLTVIIIVQCHVNIMDLYFKKLFSMVVDIVHCIRTMSCL